MQRLFNLAATLALLGLALWSVTMWDAPAPQPSALSSASLTERLNPTPRPSSRPLGAGDRDCRDFTSHARAQAFFEAQGPGDPHNLDGDGDGIACERLY